MDEKLKWYLDWYRRGQPLEYKGKIVYLSNYGILEHQDKLIVKSEPSGPTNRTMINVEISFVSKNEVKII